MEQEQYSKCKRLIDLKKINLLKKKKAWKPTIKSQERKQPTHIYAQFRRMKNEYERNTPPGPAQVLLI